MAIWRDKVTVTAAGGAGAATGTANTARVVNGMIRAIHLDYSASAASTTDVTISEAGQSPAMPVLAVADNNTDGWYFPLHQAVDSADGTELTGAGAPVVAAAHLTVAVAQANANDTVTATIVWDDGR